MHVPNNPPCPYNPCTKKQISRLKQQSTPPPPPPPPPPSPPTSAPQLLPPPPSHHQPDYHSIVCFYGARIHTAASTMSDFLQHLLLSLTTRVCIVASPAAISVVINGARIQRSLPKAFMDWQNLSFSQARCHLAAITLSTGKENQVSGRLTDVVFARWFQETLTPVPLRSERRCRCLEPGRMNIYAAFFICL